MHIYARVLESSRKVCENTRRIRENTRADTQKFATNTRKFAKVLDKYANTRADTRKFSRSSRRIRESSRSIFAYMAHIHIYESSRRIREVRESSRQIRGGSRADTHEFAEVRERIRGYAWKFARVREDSHMVHSGYSWFPAVYLRMGPFTSAIGDMRAPQA